MSISPRTIAGAAVLVIVVAVGLVLIPPYAANWQLQRYVNELTDDPATATQAPGVVQARVLNKAASLGLPVRGEDVSVTSSQGSLRISVLYIVHVDVAGYTVDLHFRPTAGGG